MEDSQKNNAVGARPPSTFHLPSSLSNLKVAIVCDWLVGGGAERVVLELHNMFPEAPIYTSFATEEWRQKLDGKVVTGWLQHWPFSKLRKFLPVLRIWWFRHINFDGYDLVISSSGNGEAKDIRVPKSTRHIIYCHSPTHYYWRHYDQYLDHPGFGLFDPLARLGLRLLVGPLRRRDYRAAQRPDKFIANSTHIQADIKQYYGRDSVVIHPPVATERFKDLPNLSRHGFVTVGRQIPFKHLDILIAACNQLNLPLAVLGNGPEHDKLVKLAGPTIAFITGASDSDVASCLASAQAFLFAAEEDFGIAPVEALAAGTPVIAYKGGGALDYVVPGKTGEFFDHQTSDSLVVVLKSFDAKKYSAPAIKANATKFSAAVFRQKIIDFLE